MCLEVFLLFLPVWTRFGLSCGNSYEERHTTHTTLEAQGFHLHRHDHVEWHIAASSPLEPVTNKNASHRCKETMQNCNCKLLLAKSKQHATRS